MPKTQDVTALCPYDWKNKKNFHSYRWDSDTRQKHPSREIKSRYENARRKIRQSTHLKSVEYEHFEETMRESFILLAEQWRKETRFLSSSDQKILHPAYQSIIAMGKAAVPLVLEELEARRGHWAWALRFMTGVDPVPDGANIDGARNAWLEWGRQAGLK